MEFIDLKTQYQQLRKPINERIQTVLDHGQYILGAEVAELERELASYVGVDHCVAVASGTDAILMALMVADVGAGDEVITTAFSFIAAGEMIALLGATPVFLDIDSHSYNMDATLLEAAITPRTKAIMPVSLYGQCADLDSINSVVEQHNLPVIEDAAQSFGATYKGRRSCSLSKTGVTSFFPSKPLGCYGEGGAIFTDDDSEAKVIRQIRVHGEDRRYHHSRLGINGRMDNLQAAVLLAKLEIFGEEVDARRRIGTSYSEMIEAAFESVEPSRRAIPPIVEDHNHSVYAQYTVSVPNRKEVIAGMTARGIPTAVHYPVPLYRQPVFLSLEQEPSNFPNAEAAAAKVLSLPMHPYLTREQQAEVVAALKASVVG